MLLPERQKMRWVLAVCLGVFSSCLSAVESQSFILGDTSEFRVLNKEAESSAWAWCSATAGFAADLLEEEEIESPAITELANIAEASENAIFFLHWWQYEMRLYRQQDSLKHSAGVHEEVVEGFRELAKKMIGERRAQIHQASHAIIEKRELLKHRIRKTLALCEGNVEGMEYYSHLWNGWMTANRAKLNF